MLSATAAMLALPAAPNGRLVSNAPLDDGPQLPVRGPKEGDPFGMADGAVYDAVTDLRVSCPDIDLVFRRSYGSWSQRSGSLGIGWTHAYDWHVETNSYRVCVFSAGENGVTDGVHKFAPVAPGESTINEDGYTVDPNGKPIQMAFANITPDYPETVADPDVLGADEGGYVFSAAFWTGIKSKSGSIFVCVLFKGIIVYVFVVDDIFIFLAHIKQLLSCKNFSM